jgi:lysophospholipase L1-like esterase
MKNILCFGDSNTWGYNPTDGSRHPRCTRWTGVLQQELGDGIHVTEEGLCGRTTAFSEPFRFGRNGRKMLAPLLESHAPLDLLCIALGVNDLKPIFSASAYDSALGLASLVDIAQKAWVGANGKELGILIVAPTRCVTLSTETSERFAAATDKFPELLKEYAKVAERYGTHYFDSNEVAVCSPDDGVHLDAENHTLLGLAIAARVRKILAD